MINNVLLLLQRWSIIRRYDLLQWIPIVIVPLHTNVAPVPSSSDDAVAARVTVPRAVAAAIVPMRAPFGRRSSAVAATTCAAAAARIPRHVAAGRKRNLWCQTVRREHIAKLVIVLSWRRCRCPCLHETRIIRRLLLEWLQVRCGN